MKPFNTRLILAFLLSAIYAAHVIYYHLVLGINLARRHDGNINTCIINAIAALAVIFLNQAFPFVSHKLIRKKLAHKALLSICMFNSALLVIALFMSGGGSFSGEDELWLVPAWIFTNGLFLPITILTLLGLRDFR